MQDPDLRAARSLAVLLRVWISCMQVSFYSQITMKKSPRIYKRNSFLMSDALNGCGSLQYITLQLKVIYTLYSTRDVNTPPVFPPRSAVVVEWTPQMKHKRLY